MENCNGIGVKASVRKHFGFKLNDNTVIAIISWTIYHLANAFIVAELFNVGLQFHSHHHESHHNISTDMLT